MAAPLSRVLCLNAATAAAPLRRAGVHYPTSLTAAAAACDRWSSFGHGREAASRYSWARWCALATAGGCTLALSGPHRRRAPRCAAMQRVPLGPAGELQDGTMKEVDLGPEGGGAKVLLHRHGGVFYATAPQCSHYGAPLRKGVTSAGGRGGPPTVSCPLHDATFDLKTGQVVRGPGLDGIAAYKVEVVDGTVYAEIPADLADGSSKQHQKFAQKMVKRSPDDKRTFALIGGGAASLAAAETLRQEGFGGRIVMLTKESHLPYDRVVLSKAFGKSAESLRLRPEDFFEKWDIEVVRDACVTRLDARGQEVHYRVADGDESTMGYDSVLVATGGTPRKLFVPGATMDGIFTLRTPEDAAQISKHAKKGQRVVVVGGSFIGMEIASSMSKAGCDVSVVAMETVPFERVLGKKVGASFARLLQKEGVKWYGSSQVSYFRGNEHVHGVELDDGEVILADAVVVGAGVLPNTRFIEGASLDKNGAIIVNPLLHADRVPTLFAAGDVCSYPSMWTGTQVRIEHWDVATQQGRAAARNMLGQHRPFTTVPFFWSSIFGKNLRFVGHAPEALDRVIIEGDVSKFEFISYYTENDEVRAVATINKDPLAVACAELMRRGKMPKVSELMLGVANADVIMQRLRELSCTAAT